MGTGITTYRRRLAGMNTKILIPIARSIKKHIMSEYGIKTAVRIDPLRFISNQRRVGWYYNDRLEEKITIKVLDNKKFTLSELSKLKRLVREHMRFLYEFIGIVGRIRDVKITFVFPNS